MRLSCDVLIEPINSGKEIGHVKDSHIEEHLTGNFSGSRVLGPSETLLVMPLRDCFPPGKTSVFSQVIDNGSPMP